MATRAQTKREAAEALLRKSHAEQISKSDVVRGTSYPNPPISVRLSAPLLERLDRIANTEHRTRGNLIQHILWEYVRGRDNTS